MAAESGYNKHFLGPVLSFPKLDEEVLAPLRNGSGYEIKLTHFSVFVHKNRRLPFMSAVNIKGEAYSAASRAGSEPWKVSSDIDTTYQIDNRFYGQDENTFDRGHLVRRVDPCWGPREVADRAEEDTFTWVNCTPQHRKLNQQGGVWYQLEQHIIEQGVKNKIGNVSVFAGPVLAMNDPLFKKQYLNTDVPIPLLFWKVIVWKKSDGKLYAVGFMMSQWEFIKTKVKEKVRLASEKPRLKDEYFENLKFKDHQTYQVSLSMIEKATGIRFGWRGVEQPYKANRAKTVRATPLKNIYPFATVESTMAGLAANRKRRVSPTELQQALAQLPPLSQKAVDKAIREGEGYLLKRYQIQNITL